MGELRDDFRDVMGSVRDGSILDPRIHRGEGHPYVLQPVGDPETLASDRRASVPAALIAGAVILLIVAEWAIEHPYLTAAGIAVTVALAWSVVRIVRLMTPAPADDPGHDRHHDAIQVLKILALANNRVDDSDREAIARYMVDIPGGNLPIGICRDLASADLPSPMDLDRHLALAQDNLSTDEIDRLLRHVREMRRGEMRLTPVTREWYDRVERRLKHGPRNLDPNAPALGQRSEAAFDPSLAAANALDRFDRHVASLRDQPRSPVLDRAVDAAREPLVVLMRAEIDHDVEEQVDEIVDRQFAGVVSTFAAARAVARGFDVDRTVELASQAVERVRAGLDELVSIQSGRALSRLDTVGRYVESRNPERGLGPI